MLIFLTHQSIAYWANSLATNAQECCSTDAHDWKIRLKRVVLIDLVIRRMKEKREPRYIPKSAAHESWKIDNTPLASSELCKGLLIVLPVQSVSSNSFLEMVNE